MEASSGWLGFEKGGGVQMMGLEIVNGRVYYDDNGNHICMTTPPRPDSPPDSPPVPTAAPPSSKETKPRRFRGSEMKRRKRVAKYRMYGIEGRVKASIRNGLRWFKNKCSEIIHGY